MKQALALLALLAAAPAAGQGARGQATVLMSETPGGRQAQEKWGYNDAIVVGDTVYLSGVVAGKGPDEAGLEPAYERVYRHIAATLKRAGVSWDDVVDITSFHTDVEAQIDPLAAVHKRFVKAPYPAWTAIGVSRILGGGITEIKVVAKRSTAAAGAPGGSGKE
jgi:enamine deaminase RidA (YjgF/YER057c/UK114 family)